VVIVIDSALALHATSQIYTSQPSGYQKSCSNTSTHLPKCQKQLLKYLQKAMM